MAAQADRGVPLSTLNPKFLHTNSTSHTGPFSAIAELIDNAYDPDVCAKHFWIDKTMVYEEECLSFMDDGNGLDHEAMHRMLSFGYSDKVAVKGVKPIGMYGNGFKSGAMRLGKDAIVFSKSKSTSCVGMLSQSYLKEIRAEQIVVPIVCFDKSKTNAFSVREEHKASLQDILHYSPFKTQEHLLQEIDAITLPGSTTKTGSRIIIWNLSRTSTGATEVDFKVDRYDIRIPSDVCETMNDTPQHPGVISHIPESVYSLRAYCSILYLKPRMQIIIRGQKVKSLLISKSLAYVKTDHYTPAFLAPKRIPITFGYNTKSKDQYGIMMYHKNRLIKGYQRIGCQRKANNKGVGVIGVIECDFLEPTHNKQSFNETDKYRRTMNNLAVKLEEYWREICHERKKKDPNNSTPVEDTTKRPDQSWVQCDDCCNWRKLPDGIDCSKLPDEWFCRMNPDPQFRSCSVEEELEDSDDDQPSYCKTYKLQEREDKKNEEMKRQKDEEAQKRLAEQSLVNLSKENQALQLQLCQKTVQSPPTPTIRGSKFNTKSKSSSLSASAMSQAASSPSSSNGFPVIANVCSLSPGTPRGKRTLPFTRRGRPKIPRGNGVHQGTSDTPPLSYPSVPVNNDDDDDDDDIFIVESASDPKPETPGFDLTKVKTEQEQSEANVDMQLECSDDPAMDVAPEMNVAGTGSAAVGTSPPSAPPTEMANCITQTEVPKVKKEVGNQNQTEGEETAGQGGKEQSSDVDIDICVEQRAMKQESSGDASSKNQGQQTLQNRVAHHLDSEEEAGPSRADAHYKCSCPLHHHSIIEVQEQQDKLLELMQTTAQERDTFKEQVHELTLQVEDLQSRLQELPQINVENQCSHQASQTEETEGGKDYKSLFEKAKEKVKELIEKNIGASLAATETTPSTAQGEEQDTDEIVLQVGGLVRELGQRNKERDELCSQLVSLEEERANLAAQCEELRLSLQQQREEATDSSVQTSPEDAGGPADSGTDSSSDSSRSLIELRHNVGRLLLHFLPDLELDQVNYECNVIDEILEQALSNDFILRVGLRDSNE